MSPTNDGSPPERTAADVAKALGVKKFERHVLLCTASECDADRTAWESLRSELRRRRLHRRVHASEVSCLGICVGGPIAVVHPDGVWYGGVDATRMSEIVEHHLQHGQPVQSSVIAHSPS